jgi:hypothetical protein
VLSFCDSYLPLPCLRPGEAARLAAILNNHNANVVLNFASEPGAASLVLVNETRIKVSHQSSCVEQANGLT